MTAMDDANQIIEFYKQHCQEVHVISCDKCGTQLAVEVRGQSDDIPPLPFNPSGYAVIPLNDALLSSRVRLDGMTGYQCGAPVDNPYYKTAMAQYKKQLAAVKDNEPKPAEPDVPQFVMCLNDTRANPFEESASPSGAFLPHEQAKAVSAMREADFKPLIRQRGNKEHRESFTAERVK